jgi:hypothetical protein
MKRTHPGLILRMQAAYDFQKAKEEFLHNPPSLKKFKYAE